MRALIVEDDRTIAEFVVEGTREAGFAVDHARRRRDRASQLATTVPYDVAIVDLMLPQAATASASSRRCARAASRRRC